MGCIHLFQTANEFNSARTDNYVEPWLSYTKETSGLSLNKTEEEKRQELLKMPLTFNITSNGYFYFVPQENAEEKTIQYSINDGEWINLISSGQIFTSAITVEGLSGTFVYGGYDEVRYEYYWEYDETKLYYYYSNIPSNEQVWDENYNFYDILTLKNDIINGTKVNVVNGDTVRFKGNNETYDNNSFGLSCNFSIEGNIMSLVDSTGFTNLTTLASSYTFYHLFYNCTGLTSAENLVLPATTLTEGCYTHMFYGCTSLTTAPELPATTLTNSCYSYMFQGCTSLTTAPELPATTLAEGCYNTMFDGCTSLTTAPELPATTLTSNCYAGMFNGCTSLTTAPELPATTLANWCYFSMFYGCTNLNYIKCLATDISATYCTNNWVNSVASTGTFVKNANMSSWITGVNGIPNGWDIYNDGVTVPPQSVASQDAGTYEVKIFSFVNWAASTEDSWITFTKSTGTSEDTSFTFSVTSTNEPRTGFITFSTNKNEVVLKVIQDSKFFEPLTFNIVSSGTIVWGAQQTAYTTTIEYKKNNGEWTSITSNTGASAPSISVSDGDTIQFRGNNATYCSNSSRYNTFKNSTAKFEIEGNIMSLINSTDFATATTLASSYTFYYLFNYCTGLTSTENLILPATILANYCYSNMFGNCTGLTTAPELPATTLASSCYNGMFQGCTSLTSAPELPATRLTGSCYGYMFSGCTSLNYIKCLATTNVTTSNTSNWVKGVASTGTFVKSLNMSSWTTGNNGIPSNWSIKDWGFGISRSIITLSDIASAKTITITSSFNNWTATTNDNWYGLSQYTGGTGDTTITITANTQDTFRTGTVTFTDGTNVETLTVNEKYLVEMPLTFNIISSGKIYWKAQDTAYTVSIEYKKNDEEWASITATTGGTSISVNGGDVVQLKGDNVACSSGNTRYNSFSGSTAKFEVEGNIMSLIDSENFATATTLASSYSFNRLFGNCTGLTSTENLVLPATTLSDNCYQSMFDRCTSLTTAPALLATTLTQACYSGMFSGCTGLTTAPVLPATTLANNCYYQMFYGCSSLTTAPELPATTLAVFCYEGMFSGCISLTTAPSILPATSLTQYCYQQMFFNCTSLTTAPVLPATTLAQGCYSSMFSGCISLTTAPSILPATTLAQSCYQSMFDRCTSLTTAPELPATTLVDRCYMNMFYNCTSLTTAPALPATTLTYSCYNSMFYGCSSLTTAPALPATTLAQSCYKNMFYICQSLTTAPALSATTLAQDCYNSMFYLCTSLTTAPELPATTLAQSCYQSMFARCTSLTTAPVLSATTLTGSCYNGMFSGCTSLNYIKCLATNISASNCTTNWANGVASTGTFVKDASMTSWTTGTSGIPNNWTVQDA